MKEHLLSRHYSWPIDTTDPASAEAPARRLFDRYNGNQVLRMINFFGNSIGKLTIQDGRRLEELIEKQMPDSVKSEQAVFNWLRSAYLYYWN